MGYTDIWKYCTRDQEQEFLLSLNILGKTGWTRERQLGCLYAVSNHAESHYHRAQIPKRDGSVRTLAVPDRLLKRIQRNILHNILDSYEISIHATAYHRGAGILDNASLHVGKPKVLKLDIRDFFGSILFPDILSRVFSKKYFPPSVGTLLTYLCCYREYLPQGAPTSAALSNIVMKTFDEHMGLWCDERGIAYTRYCDDMTFSGDFDAKMVKDKAEGFLRAMGFSLNSEKTALCTNHVRQTVTGVVVNEKPQAARDYRRKLRQDIYYCARFGAIRHVSRTAGVTGLACDPGEALKYLESLYGRVNFVLQLNPEDSCFLKAREQVRVMIRELREEIAE